MEEKCSKRLALTQLRLLCLRLTLTNTLALTVQPFCASTHLIFLGICMRFLVLIGKRLLPELCQQGRLWRPRRRNKATGSSSPSSTRWPQLFLQAHDSFDSKVRQDCDVDTCWSRRGRRQRGHARASSVVRTPTPRGREEKTFLHFWSGSTTAGE